MHHSIIFLILYIVKVVIATMCVSDFNGTVIIGLIENTDETVYLDTINYTFQWCKTNHLDLNVGNKKAMIHEFTKTPPTTDPVTLIINLWKMLKTTCT